ncbi:MerR family transcriptional regulator [Deinococcus cellulosilyticus]|uniref:MerR family transcriptional regulator n=1 Tax=Deinococcus cellulosilyticus (strain DSM 18568 / NBRC 106333 / KACC 11606 / 5516J-15) TaxID=1223518 RepID=A0A511N0B4_DEIC1|nr:MerR family transcriptional regulator [Deinococcus cellulosilyticus]GEM46259.1 MerR family transcriptional regulator [Deinococcus cellulosilyticus NBRC 106333 = KACC 11606]
MRDLIPSGRFAQIARLTRKALRIYAEMGLLRPVHTDPGSGYHYYSLSQLEEARRISRLRDFNMPLEEIREALRSWHAPELSSLLQEQQRKLQAQQEHIQNLLKDLHAFMQTEQSLYPVSTKSVLPQRCISKRARCAPEHSCAFIDATHAELMQALKAADAHAAGASIVRYHDSGPEDMWDVEVCQPFTVDGPMLLPEGLDVQTLPGGTAAYTLHAGECGGDFGMQGAYEAVWNWIRTHGHETVGPPYEVYLFEQGNTENAADYRTEIAWLIR